MRNIKNLSRLCASVRKVVVMCLATLTGVSSLLAQNGSSNIGYQVIDSMNSSLLDLVEVVVRFLKTLMGFGAIIMLIYVVYMMFKGDREVDKRLTWWIVGLALGFVLLEIVQRAVFMR